MTDTVSQPVQNPISILYVDDEPDFLYLGKTYIELNKDFRIHTISSASEALNSPELLKYDAIVSDYQMPGMDGIEFLKEIRKRDENIPFILFTGRGREEVVINAINNGADFYIQKGGDTASQFAELIHKVCQAVKQKRAHEVISNLRERQNKLAEAMNLINVAYWEFDVINNIFSFDDRFYALYGTTAEQECGTEITAERYSSQFVHPDDRELVLSETYKLFNNPDPDAVAYLEHRIIRRDGQVRYILVGFGAIRDNNGTVIRTYGANQDITERKLAELALEKANRQINLLSGITRHDILNNISVLYAYLDKARLECTDPRFSEYLMNMEEVIETIQSKIEFTRIYEEIGTEKPIWIPLRTIIPSSTASIHLICDTGIEDISIFADPLVDTLLSNLLDNSIRHGEHVTEIRISPHISDNNLVILWEDNGVGIPEEEKEQIFERGFGKHTGLGLFLLREILALTGISIRETGVPGFGARFEIIIPNGSFKILEH